MTEIVVEEASSDGGKNRRPLFLDEAEAEKFRAEGEAALVVARAKALEHAATARRAEAEAVNLELTSEVGKISVAREMWQREKELASNEFHYIYNFDTGVDERSVKAAVKQFTEWERMAKGQKLQVELQITSPGGGIIEGFVLVDFIEAMHARGHVINTTAFGMAASMGGVLLQVGKTRRMGQSAALLIHEASFGAGGSMGKVEDMVDFVKKLQQRILDIFAQRAAGSEAAKPMTKRQIAAKWERRDWWLTAQEALEHGFVDELV